MSSYGKVYKNEVSFQKMTFWIYSKNKNEIFNYAVFHFEQKEFLKPIYNTICNTLNGKEFL